MEEQPQVEPTASDVEPMASDRVTFTRAGVAAGARAAVPIGLGVASYGLVFDALAGQAHLSLLEALLMSGLVFAGASQFVALGLWVAPLPIAAIVGATLIVNLRLVLMGAALRPWFARLSPFAAYGSIFFVADENWALTMAQFARGGRDAAFLLGSGLVVFAAWTGSTLVGRVLGAVLPNPARLGLDFAFTAIFLALLVGFWKGRSSLAPWVVAAIVAVVAARVLGGEWYILLGGLAGTIGGALRHDG